MDTEYFNELKETAADVKAAITRHLQDYGRPNDTDDIVCLDTIALVSEIADCMAHRIKCDYLPQHSEELYRNFIEGAVQCIVAANKVRNG